MSASCKITNNTGKTIVFSSVSKVNDDATWSVVPAPGTKIADGGTCVISMGNASFFPRGVGFNAEFVDTDLDTGSIYLDDPAVGAHSWRFGGDFNYNHSNPHGNSYDVSIVSK